jgi:steroid delta-isomerase-like uncharacterized protein
MSTEENKSLVQQWVKARNTHDIEAAVALWTEDQQDIIRKAFNGFSQAFPDIHITINDLIAEGDKVVGRFTMDATHRGFFQTIPATDKTVKITGIDIYTIVDGKLASLIREADNLSLLKQLGTLISWQGQPVM